MTAEDCCCTHAVVPCDEISMGSRREIVDSGEDISVRTAERDAGSRR
jgi:hypothetical protein